MDLRLMRLCRLACVVFLISWPARTEAQARFQPVARSIPGGAFLSASASGDALEIALRFARTELPGKTRTSRGGKPLALADFQKLRVRDRLRSQHNGVTHLHLQQRINGLEVYQAGLQAHVARDGSLIAMHNRLVSTTGAPAPEATPVLSAAECVQRAAQALNLPVPAALPVDTTGGNSLALQLVVDGCKLQPATPSYVQARDATLQADLVNNAGGNQFAKQLHGGTGTPGIDYHVNGIHYAVEVSNDLLAWSSGSSFVSPVSVTPDPDGFTDTVLVRTLQSHRFFRLRITRTSSG